MLLRIDDSDDGTAETLEGCAKAVSELADRGLVAMVEPLPYHREADGSLRLLKDVAVAVPRHHDRERARHDQRLHLAEDAVLRRARGGLRRDDPAVRRARRRAAPRPGRGPGVLGPRAHPAGGARPGRRPGPALPARRRGVRRGRRGRAAVLRARAGELRDEPATVERRTPVRSGGIVDITPEDAGWDWTGLRVLRLAPGEPQTVRHRRVGAVRAAARRGSLPRDASATSRFELQGRDSVFSRRHRLLLRRPRQRRARWSPRRVPRWRCRRRAASAALPAGVRRRRGRARSRCAAPDRRPGRSRTSACPGSGTTRTS